MAYSKRLEEAWKEDRPYTRTRHPEGTFQGEIVKAQVTTGQKGKVKGHTIIAITLKTIGGEKRAIGKKTFSQYNLNFPANKKLDLPSGISRFKGFLKMECQQKYGH